MDNSYFIETTVIALHRTDGTVMPEQIVIDDIAYPIDRVLRITPLVTTKGGGTGQRYEILASGKRITLFLEDAASYCSRRRWFSLSPTSGRNRSSIGA